MPTVHTPPPSLQTWEIFRVLRFCSHMSANLTTVTNKQWSCPSTHAQSESNAGRLLPSSVLGPTPSPRPASVQCSIAFALFWAAHFSKLSGLSESLPLLSSWTAPPPPKAPIQSCTTQLQHGWPCGNDADERPCCVTFLPHSWFSLRTSICKGNLLKHGVVPRATRLVI